MPTTLSSHLVTAAPAVAVRPPLLIYVNVPFCNSKCHFCDWVVQVPVGDLRLGPESSGRTGHLAAVREQIRIQAPALREHYRTNIMYWGGGTASILSCGEIERLHGSLADAFDLTTLRETTIEGSPESMQPDKLSLLRQLGFDRISIGVQSFEDSRLRVIGRSHSAEQARTAVRAAAAAGFDNVNIDLIVGFPDQSVDEVDRTVRAALELPVNHFSVYPYRASFGTVLRKQLVRRDRKTDLDNQLLAYRRAAELLTANGYPEYAMSYFGDPRCQSDEAYYQLLSDWIGFGSGANSLIGHRYLSYQRGKLHGYNERPDLFDVNSPAGTPALVLHFLSQALTTVEGMGARVFQERTGTSLRRACEQPEVSAYLRRMSEHGRLIVDREGIRIHPEDIAQVYVALNWIEEERTPLSLGPSRHS